MRWKIVTLGDVVELEQGLAFNKKNNHLMVDAGIPLLRITDLINNTESRFVDAEKVPKKFMATPSDIIYTRTGQVGLVFRGRTGIVHNNCFRIFPNSEIDSSYLYWFLKEPTVAQYANTIATGVAQPDLSHPAFKSMPFSYPPLPTQKKIASVLSAYDDLIENNERRIKILEEMAQSIYREWFVNYRFPGHESVRMVDSELGEIPEGWEMQSVKDSFETLGGGTPSKKVEEYWDDGHINWYTPSDLTREKSMFLDRSDSQITSLGLTKSSASLFPAGSVMLTSRATIGKVSIAASEACTNQGFITCLPNDKFPSEYIYFWLLDNTEQFIQLASGTTFLEIGRRVFRDIPLKVPDYETVSLFTEAVRPLMQQVHTQQRKNQNLRQTRDLLLPKLISGELGVEELDIAVAF